MCALQNSNHIGVDGAEAIVQALTQNSTVKSLLLVRFVFGVVCVCRCWFVFLLKNSVAIAFFLFLFVIDSECCSDRTIFL